MDPQAAPAPAAAARRSCAASARSGRSDSSPKKIFRLPIMCANRNSTRTAPVTAMTNFSVHRGHPRRTSAPGHSCRPGLPQSPRDTVGYCAAADKARNPTDSHHHDLICRGWSYASPSALRRGDANCASLFPPSRVRTQGRTSGHPSDLVEGPSAVESATAGAAAHSGRAAMRHDRCVRAFGPARAPVGLPHQQLGWSRSRSTPPSTTGTSTTSTSARCWTPGTRTLPAPKWRHIVGTVTSSARRPTRRADR